ncbi:MAG TPA: phosphatidate cytidylyltransferase [Elusimicrobiota bacterium]|nr:phosphatidate cytidylyltransferase [Elusimicrobiota bacterium]HMX42770.1 phosphatidate cytidylyltransferase [Elusimicrobiota bacterium]HMX94286.1 phosphatidate cytidylyltransferase [Elusimicrobiota bacterium]HMZ26022.1 phosphatidate cytidylyltransferase [Elusimicrobiota bacterium]HNA59579.1 phosphatidate cytidylyltransferase [Elusimicrobiota bacterium]
MVLPRVLTALVLGPLFLWVLYLGSIPFLIFMGTLILLGLWEFHSMAEAGGHANQSVTGIAAALLVTLSLLFPGLRGDAPFCAQAPAFSLTLAAALMIFRELGRSDKSLSMLRMAMTCAGVMLIAWPLGGFILLREARGATPELFHAGRSAAFFLVALIWTQDTAAWAVGMTLGKHRLAPQVSPKKSWEGAVGGLLAAVLVSLFLREGWMKSLFGRGETVLVAIVLGILAQASDLAESLFKRCFGVKDSSGLLPGHGGILDRFDSFLLSGPVLYFYLISVGRIL